jgi:hypothetical protein
VLEGDVELVACQVVDAMVGRSGRHPVVDDDLGVDWVPWGQGGENFRRGGHHLLGEGVERAGALLDLMPCLARVHDGNTEGGKKEKLLD